MRKNIICLFIALSGYASLAFGQDPHEVKLGSDCQLINVMNTNNGFVMLTGRNYYLRTKNDWKVTYFSPHLAQKYEVPVPGVSMIPVVFRGYHQQNYATKFTNEIPDALYPAFMVASPSGNNVYYIRHGNGGLFGGTTNTQKVIHIDSSGYSSAFTLKRELKYSHVNVVFADDDYLYYVTKEKDKDKKARRRKHAFPKLHLIRVGKDKTPTNITLELPELDPDATEWSYLGNTGVVSYFVSRTFDEDNKKQTFRVVVVDHNGKVQDDFKMDVGVKQGEFMPVYNFCGTEGTHVVDNHNVEIHYSSYTTAGGSTQTSVSYIALPEAYGNIMLDPLTNGFYIYGMTRFSITDKKDKRKLKRGGGGDPNGYYVFKFDQDGKQLWSYEGKLTGLDDDYRSRTPFCGRNLKLSYGTGGNLRLQTYAYSYPRLFQINPTGTVYTYEINSQTGKFISGYNNTFETIVTPADLGSCHKSGDKSDIGKFQSRAGKGEYSQLNLRMVANNIIIRNFYNDAKLELYDFTDE